MAIAMVIVLVFIIAFKNFEPKLGEYHTVIAKMIMSYCQMLMVLGIFKARGTFILCTVTFYANSCSQLDSLPLPLHPSLTRTGARDAALQRYHAASRGDRRRLTHERVSDQVPPGFVPLRPLPPQHADAYHRRRHVRHHPPPRLGVQGRRAAEALRAPRAAGAARDVRRHQVRLLKARAHTVGAEGVSTAPPQAAIHDVRSRDARASECFKILLTS